MFNQMNNRNINIMTTLIVKKEKKQKTEKIDELKKSLVNIQSKEPNRKNENLKSNIKPDDKNKNRQNSKENTFSDEDLKKLKESFDLFDTEGKGVIDPEELKQALISLNLNNEKTKKRMIKVLDEFISKNKGKKMTFEDFIEAFSYDGSDDENIKDIFDSMADEKNPNIISFESLKKLAKELGENMTDDEIKDMMIRASKNNKPELTFEEFYEIMKK